MTKKEEWKMEVKNKKKMRKWGKLETVEKHGIMAGRMK